MGAPRLSIVSSPAPSAPCRCEKCRHPAARIHRAWAEQLYAEMPHIDLEAEVADRWHSYWQAFDRVRFLLPPRAVSDTLQASDTDALAHLRAWHDREGEDNEDDGCDRNIAVLAGPPGTGKTVAAVWVVLHRLAADEPVYMTAAELARMKNYGDEYERLLDTGALLLDDLGAEYTTKRSLAMLDEIVDRHYRSCSQMIITTNCTAKEFRARYGRRIVDRLAERGVWIATKGPSMRGAR